VSLPKTLEDLKGYCRFIDRFRSLEQWACERVSVSLLEVWSLAPTGVQGKALYGIRGETPLMLKAFF